MNHSPTTILLLLTLFLTTLLTGCIENDSNIIGQAFGINPEEYQSNLLLGPDTNTSHLACIRNQCKRVPGAGTNECATIGRPCKLFEQFRFECRNNQCVQVPGTGPSTCLGTNQFCITCIEYQSCHLECRNLQCTQVEGLGENQCMNNSQCIQAAPDFNLEAIHEGHMNESGTGAISFTVKNIGTADYNGTLKHRTVLYKLGSSVQVVSDITWDASNDNYAIGSSFTYTQVAELPNGDYKFQAIADSNLNVSELDEGNNKMTYYFTITDANAELCNSVPNENQLFGNYLNSSSSAVEFSSELFLPPESYSEPLQNCYYYSQGGPIALVHPLQSVGVHANAAMFAYLTNIKDLAASINPQDYNYTIQFQTPIPSNLDFNHGDFAVIPFLGERYKIIDMTKRYGLPSGVKLQNMNDSNDSFWIMNRYEFPFDENGTHTNMKWVISFIVEGTSLKGISIKNNMQYWAYTNPLYSPDSFYGSPQPAMLLQNSGSPKTGFAKAWFEGFGDGQGGNETRETVEFLKGFKVANGTTGATYGAIHYFDTDGNDHYVPMAIVLVGTPAANQGFTFQFDAVTHAYSTNQATNFTRFLLKQNSSDTTLTNPDYNILLAITDTDYDYSHVVQLMGKNGKQYKYFVRRAYNGHEVWLVLAGYSSTDPFFDGYIDSIKDEQESTVGELFLLGTVTNDAALYPPVSKASFDSSNPNNLFRSVYYPDTYDYNGTPSGPTTGIYRTAVFRLRETLGNGYVHPYIPDDNETNSFEIFIDTENGNKGTIDTAAIWGGTKPGWNGPKTALIYYNPNPLQLFAEYQFLPGQSSGNYKKAYTDNGSRVELENRELSIQLPSEQLPVYLRIAVEAPPAIEQWPPWHAER